MTYDEAYIFISDGHEKERYEIAARAGGILSAINEAAAIARESIKRCRDFGTLRARIGDPVYWLCIEEDPPDICEYTIGDISAAGMIYIKECEEWCDPADPEERLYLTYEEATAKLAEEKMRRDTEG